MTRLHLTDRAADAARHLIGYTPLNDSPFVTTGLDAGSFRVEVDHELSLSTGERALVALMDDFRSGPLADITGTDDGCRRAVVDAVALLLGVEVYVVDGVTA